MDLEGAYCFINGSNKPASREDGPGDKIIYHSFTFQRDLVIAENIHSTLVIFPKVNQVIGK
jgi:hypothetical protein